MYCDREVESQTILDISGIGSGLGALIGGLLSDLFGRKPMLYSGFSLIVVSLVTLLFCQTVQIFTLGLFLLGFSVYMALLSVLVTTFELLPHNYRFPFVIMTEILACCGVYLGICLRLIFYSSWRALAGSLLALTMFLTSLLAHMPLSPRYRLYQDKGPARDTLRRLHIGLEEGEEILVPESDTRPSSSPLFLTFDYKTHKQLLVQLLVLMFLTSVVGMTTTPTAGQIWSLVRDKNSEYPIRATLQLISIPAAFLLYHKNVNPRFSVLLLGWLAIACYFIGELPLGPGIFNINNVMGVILGPIDRVLYMVITYMTLQVTPTCYRASVFGLSIALEKCFLKIGDIMDGLDYLNGHSATTSDLHDTSFLVFGVVFLSFVYVASYLPVLVYNILPNSICDFNSVYGARGHAEQTYLLRDLTGH